jgi:hypothetical protein
MDDPAQWSRLTEDQKKEKKEELDKNYSQVRLLSLSLSPSLPPSLSRVCARSLTHSLTHSLYLSHTHKLGTLGATVGHRGAKHDEDVDAQHACPLPSS